MNESDRVRLLYVAGAPNIGDLRNLGCSHAQGSIIAHWDDDDYSAPGRLADQLERLQDSRKDVTGYHSMRFTDGVKWWEYRGAADYALGTSLMYRCDWWADHPFPSLQIGEDNAFGAAARMAGAIVCTDAGQLMHASIHATNTSPRNVTAGNWRQEAA